MESRGFVLASALLMAALVVPACGGGGGGGGGGAPSTLALTDVDVTSQPNGPLAPFGTTQGGDTAVLGGSGFATGLTVQVGPRAAVVQSVTPTTVTITTPPGAEGFATVTIRNPGGDTIALADVFRYVLPPTILSIAAETGPTTGEARAPIAGGETIAITGTNLKSGLQAFVDGAAVAVTFVNSTRATFSVPAVNSEQAVDVRVRNPEGLQSTLNRGLVYTQEFSLARADSILTESRANHLYRRAGFGAPPAVVQQAVNDGLGATVQRLLDFTNDDAVEQTALGFYGATVPPRANINTRTNKEWWLHQMIKNPNPFQERLAFFLHDHFATSERDFNDDARWFLHEQVKLLRRFAVATTDQTADGASGLGYDWKQLCIEICKDRAMLDWLDGRQSTRFAPNENFPRELWELFMLGEGVGYTEADIQEAARAFTGFYWYRVGPTVNDRLDVRYLPGRHDADPKTILGATGNYGYDDVAPFYQTGGTPNDVDPSITTDSRDTDGGVVALTLQQRPVEASRFIVTKLWEFFVYAEPHDIVVDELALDLRSAGPNQWNLRPVLEKMLRSKAMFSSRAIKNQVKSPVEFAIGFLRTTGVDLSANAAVNASAVRARLETMGQVVLDPPDVNGWPDGLSWMASQAMVERYNFLAFSVQQLDDTPTQIEPLLPPSGQRSPAQLVDHVASLLGVQLSGNSRTRYIEYVNSQMVSGQVVPLAFDPNNDTHLRMKTRGLLYMIGQHYEGHQD